MWITYVTVIFCLSVWNILPKADAILCHRCRYAESEEIEHSLFSTESMEVGFQSCKDGKGGVYAVDCGDWVCMKLSYELDVKVGGEDTDIDVIVRDCVPRYDLGRLNASKCYDINEYRTDNQLQAQVEALLDVEISKINHSSGDACFCDDEDRCNSATTLAVSMLSVLVCMIGAMFFRVH